MIDECLFQILCIHLKRFRHEFYSSKISTYISFPLHSLEMKTYLHKGHPSFRLFVVLSHLEYPP